MEDAWQAEHLVLVHSSQKALPKKTKTYSNSSGMGLCAVLGTCVCKEEIGRQAVVFWRKLTKCLKVYLVKVNKKPTKQRRQFETGGFVLGLLPGDKGQRRINDPAAGDRVEEIFFHVGHANYKTWDFGCVHLTKLSFDETSGTLWLSSLDLDNHLVVKSAVQYFKDVVDFRYAWSLQYYILLSDNETVGSLENMSSKYLQVKKHLSPNPFWRGATLEMKTRQRKQQRKPTAKSDSGVDAPQERGRGRSRASGRSRSASQRPLLDDNDMDDDDMNMIMDMDMEDGEDDQDQDQDHDPVNDAMSDLEALFRDNFSDDEDGENGEEEEQQVEVEPNLDSVLDQLFTEFDCSDNENENMQPQDPEKVEDEDHPPQHALDVLELELAAPQQPVDSVDGGPDAKRPRKEETQQRAQKVSETAFLLPKNGGEIRYNVRGFMRAHCPNPDHGTCTRQRQTTAGRKGAGRPIGSLVCWLQDAFKCQSKSEHIAQLTQPFIKRKAARVLFNTWPGSDCIGQFERKRYSSEEDDEPELMP